MFLLWFLYNVNFTTAPSSVYLRWVLPRHWATVAARNINSALWENTTTIQAVHCWFVWFAKPQSECPKRWKTSRHCRGESGSCHAVLRRDSNVNNRLSSTASKPSATKKCWLDRLRTLTDSITHISICQSLFSMKLGRKQPTRHVKLYDRNSALWSLDDEKSTRKHGRKPTVEGKGLRDEWALWYVWQDSDICQKYHKVVKASTKDAVVAKAIRRYLVEARIQR